MFAIVEVYCTISAYNDNIYHLRIFIEPWIYVEVQELHTCSFQGSASTF